MGWNSRDETGTQAGGGLVRFDAHSGRQRQANALSRLEGLLPRRWRRWVVIRGCRFWLPG